MENKEKLQTGSDNRCEEDMEVKYSTKIHLSFAMGYFVRSFLFTVFAERVFAFYEYEISLDPILILLALIIYTIWNMFNDPIIGFISDKPNRFWSRWGRRFPWIFAMGLPYCFLIILVFAPPAINVSAQPWLMFAWLLFSTCLYDTMYSGWMTNYYALFPDKFRSDKERRKIAGLGSPIGLIATALATLLPPIFIEYGNQVSYIYAMTILSVISLVVFILSLPGSKEDEELIKCAQEFAEERNNQDSFFKSLKKVIKYRNFLAYLLAYLGFHSLITIMMASIPYIVPFVLNLSEKYEIYISAALLVGQLIGIPIWFKFMKKYGHRKLFITGILWAIISLIPLIFISDLLGIAIFIGIIGCGVSSLYMGNQLIFSDCIDEIIINDKKREEGVFLGIRTFFVRLSIIIQAITFTLTSVITGFDPEIGISPSLEAIWGLKIQFAAVPLIIMLIAGIAFWRLYDLTPEKVRQNKILLNEMEL
ncbi:MAG: MFS transporter|nr:MFS transporter [Candidatus Lokiarchaeota archaeon]MBD3202064.1 MFS transporter [Candidatus Lokiarchaeota archaeon]